MNTSQDIPRFMRRVVTGPDCWLWQGPVNSSGYGSFKLRGRVVGTHVAAYLLFVGPVPAGQWVCHGCDVRTCVNPSHLWLGSPRDNSIDRSMKLRVPHRKVTDAQVAEIRASTDSVTAIARRLGLHPWSVSQVRKGLSYTYIKPAGATS